MDLEAAKALCRSFPGCLEDTKWDHDTVLSAAGGPARLTRKLQRKIQAA